MVREIGPKSGPYKDDFAETKDVKKEVQSSGTPETQSDAAKHVKKVTGDK